MANTFWNPPEHEANVERTETFSISPDFSWSLISSVLYNPDTPTANVEEEILEMIPCSDCGDRKEYCSCFEE